jgi:hypothetical protein
MSEYLTQAEYRTLKRRLNTHWNRVKRANAEWRKAHPNGSNVIEWGDDPRIALWLAVAAEAKRGLDRFDVVVGPDDWHLWQIALDDARSALRWVGLAI